MTPNGSGPTLGGKVSPMFEAPAHAPMEFSDYLRILRRRAWVIIVVTVLSVGIAFAWFSTQDDTYTATGEVVVGSPENEVDVVTQTRVMQSDAVHARALGENENLPTIDATQDGESGGITLTAESTNPALAAAAVNAHIDAYIAYLEERAADRFERVKAELDPQIVDLQNQIANLDNVPTPTPGSLAVVSSQRSAFINQLSSLQSRLNELDLDRTLAGEEVQILRRGSEPSSPSSISQREVLLIALGIGVLLGVLAAFLIEFLDDSIRTREDLLRVAGPDVPVLGVIPVPRASRADVVSLTQPNSPAAEAYRSLRTAVHFAGSDTNRCLAVTSPKSRQGKTETVTNLAVLAAQMGQRVVAVDCDMRAPRLHDFFGLPNDVGFTSVVYGSPLSDGLKRVPATDRLFVMPSGPLPPNPAELLASQRSFEVLSSMQTDGTVVLVDTPPLALVADAAELAPVVGGVLVVATARVTRRKQLRQALNQLRQVDAPLLGLVLYRADSAETGGFGEEDSRRDRRRARRQPVQSAPQPALEPRSGIPAPDDPGGSQADTG